MLQRIPEQYPEISRSETALTLLGCGKYLIGESLGTTFVMPALTTAFIGRR